jgi:hypothetical protein
MPRGGQVKFDLTTITVDRKFVARYPNVRRGPHVLITVTEVPAADRPSSSGAEAVTPADAESEGRVRPAVDLGAMLELVGECGGHVWMAVEPPGNMTLKIHLPKRAGRQPADRRPAGREVPAAPAEC